MISATTLKNRQPVLADHANIFSLSFHWYICVKILDFNSVLPFRLEGLQLVILVGSFKPLVLS